MDIKDFNSNDEIAWCPGCGNFAILNSIKKAFVKLNKQPKDILLVSGIGQAAKLPHYIKANCFNGLHGRALPVACGAKIANKELTVVVTSGEGDSYGEGGNHFIHNIRRNIDITLIVHNNQIYGLTKGQASPTSDPGFHTKVQRHGVILEPFHSLAMAIVAGAGFVARSFSKETEFTTDLIVEAVKHKGFSLVEILQPCVSFNKKNTYQWYSERIYKLEDEYMTDEKFSALKRAMEWGDKIPIGIFYNVEKPTFGQQSGLDNNPALVESEPGDIVNLLDSLK